MLDFPRDPIAAVMHPDPYGYYADLVAHAPIARDEGLGLWVAASAEAVTAVLTDPNCHVRPQAEPIPRALLGTPAATIFGHLARMNDGSYHAMMKPALRATLTPLDPITIATQSRDQAERLIAEIAPQHGHSRLNDFAFRLSVAVIGNLLGIASEHDAMLARLVDNFVRCIAPGSTSEQLTQGITAAGELLEFFHTLVREHHSDLLTTLAREASRAEVEDAIIANGIGLLSQAYEATAGLIGNALVTLSRDQEWRARVNTDRSLLVPLVHEVSRFDPPVQNTRRFLANDAVIAGQSMRAGDAVLVVLAAANRDPAANPQPQQFDPTRAERHNFTFGIGPHACPGEVIATTIAAEGVAALLDVGLELASLADAIAYRPSANIRIPVWSDAQEEVS